MRRFVFYPRANAHGAVVALDVQVIVSRFGFGRHQIAINRRWNIDITIDGAVGEFDLQGVKTFAVTHFRDSARLNTLPQNVRSGGGRTFGISSFRAHCSCNAKEKREKKTAMTLHAAEC